MDARLQEYDISVGAREMQMQIAVQIVIVGWLRNVARDGGERESKQGRTNTNERTDEHICSDGDVCIRYRSVMMGEGEVARDGTRMG